MQLLDESVVQSDEIDSLGHMNVRFYFARMERANATLLRALGFDENRLSNAFLQRSDTYTRFLQEQFEGATLHTQGGILSLDDDILKSYIEITNPSTKAIAATFIVATQLTDIKTRKPQPLNLQQTDPTASAAYSMTVPPYAQPRSLHLGDVQSTVALAELDAKIPEIASGGMMSGRRTATIEPEDVDETGWLKRDQELMFLPFQKLAASTGEQPGPPVVNTPEGQRIGWAVMETRTLTLGHPRLGDELVYYSADIGVEEKSRHSRRWAFDARSERLIGISDNIGLCIDLDQRRAVPWPADLKRQIVDNMLPQFA